jgi:septum formation protein
MGGPRIYLASASPRRAELLAQIGVAFQVRPVSVDESHRRREEAAEYVLRLAQQKARAAWSALEELERRPVLAADTTVALDGEIFGKPDDRASARAMLLRLSGCTHEVHTAIALLHEGGAGTRISSSRVTFRAISGEEIDWYWGTGEPADKAGAYAIQGRGAIFVSHLAGSYSGVVGLPLLETWELLAALPGPIGVGMQS